MMNNQFKSCNCALPAMTGSSECCKNCSNYNNQSDNWKFYNEYYGENPIEMYKKAQEYLKSYKKYYQCPLKITKTITKDQNGNIIKEEIVEEY